MPAARNGGSRRAERGRSPRAARTREREDAEIEVELGQVVDEEAADGPHVVRTVADDRVGAEQIRRRPTAHELCREHEDRAADQRARRALGSARVSREAAAPNSASRKGATTIAGANATACARVAKRSADQPEQRQLASPRRTFEHQDEHELPGQEEGVEDVLRHHGARVDERRERDREHGRAQRQRHRPAAAGRAGTPVRPPATCTAR